MDYELTYRPRGPAGGPHSITAVKLYEVIELCERVGGLYDLGCLNLHSLKPYCDTRIYP